MEISKSKIKKGLEIINELKNTEPLIPIEAGEFDGVGGPYKIEFSKNSNNSISGILRRNANAIMEDRNCFNISHIEAFMSRCCEMYSNFSKFIFAQYRGDGERMFIIQKNLNDEYTKNGWWQTFCLSDTAIDKPGLYICRIVAYYRDKNNYPIVKVHPIEKIPASTTDFIDSVVNSLIFADIQERRYKNYTYFHGIYSEDYNLVDLELLNKNIEWIPNFDWDTFYQKLIKHELKLEDWEEIYNNLNSPTNEDLKRISNRDIVLKFAEEFPAIKKKISNDYGVVIESYIDIYVHNVNERFYNFFEEDPLQRPLEEVIRRVEERAAELKAASKSAKAAKKKAKKAANSSNS